MRLALLTAAAVLAAGCIDKPLLPSERPRPDAGEADAGAICGPEPADERMAWLETDEIRFNQRVGQIDGDCRDDVVIPGSRAAGTAPGVFVVLGRDTSFMQGFDRFVDMPAGEQPVDLALSNLVGADDILDLMVVATEGVDTAVLVYKGLGDGRFQFFAEKGIAGFELQAGSADGPLPLTFLLAQMEAGTPSLVIADSRATRIMSPSSWNDMSAIESAPVATPAAFVQDQQTQELGVVGAPDRTVDDLFDMSASKKQWYANRPGPAEFAAGAELTDGIAGVGPSVFLDMDGDGAPDVTSVRTATGPQLETLVLEPAEPGTPGTIARTVQLAGGLGDPDTVFSDFDLIDVGGDQRPEAILVEPRFDDGEGQTGSQLSVIPDLEVNAGGLVADGDPVKFVQERSIGVHDPDRIVIGAFAEDTTEILVLSSAPFFELGMCHRVVRDPLSFEPCN